MEKSKVSKANQYMDVYLGALKEPWVDYCKALGKKPGEAVKEAIELQLKKLNRSQLRKPISKQMRHRRLSQSKGLRFC